MAVKAKINGDMIITDGNNELRSLKELNNQVTNNTTKLENLTNLEPVILYENSSGTTGNITLSESASNFSHLLVFWKTTYNSTRRGVALAPTGNYWTLSSRDIDVNTYQTVYNVETMYYISGTSLNVSKSNNYNGNNSNVFYITKVIGYK